MPARARRHDDAPRIGLAERLFRRAPNDVGRRTSACRSATSRTCSASSAWISTPRTKPKSTMLSAGISGSSTAASARHAAALRASVPARMHSPLHARVGSLQVLHLGEQVSQVLAVLAALAEPRVRTVRAGARASPRRAAHVDARRPARPRRRRAAVRCRRRPSPDPPRPRRTTRPCTATAGRAPPARARGSRRCRRRGARASRRCSASGSGFPSASSPRSPPGARRPTTVRRSYSSN